MKIAFVTYEYPPDTAIGGIATYVYQIATALHDRGHHVEVFTRSQTRSGLFFEQGLVVHRIVESDFSAFANRIGELFHDRHLSIHFDVLESPESPPCARIAIERVRDIPLVVKLHTPGFLIGELNYEPPLISTQLRWYFGALRRGKIPQPLSPRSHYDYRQDLEWQQILQADEITTPSIDLGHKVIDAWQLQPAQICHIPYPYSPSSELLSIPIETTTNTVTFIGRLEVRKGILELAKAISIILKRCPSVKFRLVGAPHVSPKPGLDMEQYLKQRLQRYGRSIEFVGAVPLDRIGSVLAQTDVCVFPSRWENFPNVCLEAMAAGRGIVGSSAGGMAEMLDGGKAGVLVPPRDPASIAQGAIELLQNPELRMQLGQTARRRVLEQYNRDRIVALQEASYDRAIRLRHQKGSRPQSSTVAEVVEPCK